MKSKNQGKRITYAADLKAKVGFRLYRGCRCDLGVVLKCIQGKDVLLVVLVTPVLLLRGSIGTMMLLLLLWRGKSLRVWRMKRLLPAI